MVGQRMRYEVSVCHCKHKIITSSQLKEHHLTDAVLCKKRLNQVLTGLKLLEKASIIGITLKKLCQRCSILSNQCKI